MAQAQHRDTLPAVTANTTNKLLLSKLGFHATLCEATPDSPEGGCRFSHGLLWLLSKRTGLLSALLFPHVTGAPWWQAQGPSRHLEEPLFTLGMGWRHLSHQLSGGRGQYT